MNKRFLFCRRPESPGSRKLGGFRIKLFCTERLQGPGPNARDFVIFCLYIMQSFTKGLGPSSFPQPRFFFFCA